MSGDVSSGTSICFQIKWNMTSSTISWDRMAAREHGDIAGRVMLCRGAQQIDL
jgi:hypothetical protein